MLWLDPGTEIRAKSRMLNCSAQAKPRGQGNTARPARIAKIEDDKTEAALNELIDLEARTLRGRQTAPYGVALRAYAQFLRRTKRPAEAKVLEARAQSTEAAPRQTVDVSEFRSHR
jgi:hypothetical protein